MVVRVEHGAVLKKGADGRGVTGSGDGEWTRCAVDTVRVVQFISSLCGQRMSSQRALLSTALYADGVVV